VVPVYKGQDSLEELYRRLKAALTPITRDFEILLIEDCGGDRSWTLIKALAKRDPRVRGFQFSRNFGQHYGITAGLDHARGDWTVVMDGDLQDRPEEIPALYKKAQEGYDVVIALRGRRQDPLWKRATARMYFWLFNYLAELDYNPEAGNFRIVSRRVVQNYRSMRENLRLFGALVTWMGFKTGYVRVSHGERHEGKSTYTLAKLFKLAFETIIAYSDKPLRLAVQFGAVISFLAFVAGLYVLGKAFLQGSAVPGWSSLMVSLYFIGGIIIALLGIIGVYLGKTFDQVKHRPLYIIADATEALKSARD
jgi:dolichol-phosphate mannosyltransferase